MPLIKRANEHGNCATPHIGLTNPRTWFWGAGTVWKCGECGQEWKLNYSEVHQTFRWWRR